MFKEIKNNIYDKYLSFYINTQNSLYEKKNFITGASLFLYGLLNSKNSNLLPDIFAALGLNYLSKYIEYDNNSKNLTTIENDLKRNHNILEDLLKIIKTSDTKDTTCKLMIQTDYNDELENIYSLLLKNNSIIVKNIKSNVSNYYQMRDILERIKNLLDKKQIIPYNFTKRLELIQFQGEYKKIIQHKINVIIDSINMYNSIPRRFGCYEIIEDFIFNSNFLANINSLLNCGDKNGN